MRLTIGMQLRLLVTAVAVGFGLCILLTFRVLSERQAEGTIHADGEAVQSALETYIRDRGGLMTRLTRYLATSPRVTMLTAAEEGGVTDQRTVGQMVGNLREASGVDALLFFDSHGKALGASGLKDTTGTKGAVAGLVAGALGGKADRRIVEADGDPMIVVVEPLRVGEYVKGAMATFLRMDDRMARDTGESVRGDIAFLHEGRIISASLPADSLKLVENRTVQTLRVNGTPYIAYLQPMPETRSSERMGVVILRNLEQATAVYRQLTSAFMVVLAVVTLGSLLGGAALTGWITRPLGTLVASAKTLQKGEWPAPFGSRRKDEIGLLQRVFDDMTASMRADQARLLAMIDRDPLTELDNHRRFKQDLDQEVARADASGDELALVLVDLDRFAAFNDAHGHEAGDGLLRRVALALRAASPEYAGLARYAADTFAVLVPGAGPEPLRFLMEALRAAVAGCGAAASLGGASFREHAQEAGGLVLAAELAAGRAKGQGGDRSVTFDAVGEKGADPHEVSRLLQDGTFATIQALAAAVDAKDPYTKGHSVRVAEMARDLCAWTGGAPEEIDRIYRSGTLHDVGKIGVPDAILKKPARLDDDERRTMEAHPVLGEIIVRKVPQLEDLLPGVRHHHETYDGRGYPDGLAGEAIPRMARLMAVADTYDAMTSDRPYRKGLPIEVALAEIAKGAGTQFDPEFAAAFCDMIRRGASLSDAPCSYPRLPAEAA